MTPANDAEALARIRALGPRMRAASRLWLRGDDEDYVAKAMRVPTETLMLVIDTLNQDPMTPPAWHFPLRPSDWTTNAMARDAWVLAHTPLGNERFERRDFRTTMREHQRAHLGDAGRPMTPEQRVAQAEALSRIKDPPPTRLAMSLALMALMAPDVADEEAS